MTWLTSIVWQDFQKVYRLVLFVITVLEFKTDVSQNIKNLRSKVRDKRK